MDLYSHVRVLFSILLGLGVLHLLRGLARIVQHPKQYRVCWVRLVWSLFLFFISFTSGWWEFRLRQVTEWTFPRYFFCRSLCHPDVLALHAPVPGTNGGLQRYLRSFARSPSS